MEYLRADDERVKIRVRVAADWQGPRAERLRDGLVSVDDSITEWRTSNRAMWPDTELKGVEIDATGPLALGKITPSSIEFAVDGAASVEAGHRLLAEWFDEAGLDLPGLEAFHGKMVEFDAADGWAITADPSKCDRRDVIGTCVAEIAGFEVEYTAVCQGAYFSFDHPDGDVDAPIAELPTVTAAFLDDHRLLIVDEEEVNRDDSP